VSDMDTKTPTETAALSEGALRPPDLSYAAYLSLEGLLAQQKPRSSAHDEHLFIIIHQIKELWINLAIHELQAAIGFIRLDELSPAFKGLSRVSRIQTQLINSWDVLSTMTPADYLGFRPSLGQSSGFQSVQYRHLEFILGARNRAMIAPHKNDPAAVERLQRALDAPSIYDEVIRLLARRGFAIPAETLARDVQRTHVFDEAVEEAWRQVYADPTRWFDLYELAEELIDVEDAFQTWRFRHAKTVERIIGMRKGTGGTAGVAYLKTALEREFFPELWSVRTKL
jgi:tryptophan 2,3-dioxygenase